MAINKSYPGPQVVSTRFIVADGLVSSDYTPIYGVHQPANSVLEKIFVRVLEAPTITSGDIALEVGTESDDPNDIIDDASALNNVLDGAATIAVDTVKEMTSAMAAGVATTLRTQITDINFRLKTSTAVTATKEGKFEVSFVFRVFE
jgi:hypothetical protein